MTQDTLPGMGSGLRVVNRGKGGRHRKQVTALRRQLTEQGRDDAHTETLVTLLRACADSLDRLEHDPDASEHTLATVAGRMLDVIRELYPTQTVKPGSDPLDVLAHAAATAVRDSAPT